MKILYTNPFGTISHWTNRMGVMVELLRENHEVEYFKDDFPCPPDTTEFNKKLLKACKKFKPDVVLAHGSHVAEGVVDKYPTVVDLGSFKTSEFMIQHKEYTYNRMVGKRPIPIEGEVYEKEKAILNKAKAVVIFEGWEYDFAERIFPDANVIAISPIYIHDDHEKLPFEERDDKAIAVASKWSRRSKNGKFISHYNKFITRELGEDDKYRIISMGKGSPNVGFMEHDDLMRLMGKTKVVVFPMLTGANNTQIEALKMGCNVIVQSRHPFRVYNNPQLEIQMDTDIWSKTYKLIKKAYKEYYPIGKEIPTPEEQIKKLEEVLHGAV